MAHALGLNSHSHNGSKHSQLLSKISASFITGIQGNLQELETGEIGSTKTFKYNQPKKTDFFFFFN